MRRGQIQIKSKSENLFSCIVKDKYSVIHDRKKDNWTCTCEYGSLWGKGKKTCKHIKASKMVKEALEKKDG